MNYSWVCGVPRDPIVSKRYFKTRFQKITIKIDQIILEEERVE